MEIKFGKVSQTCKLNGEPCEDSPDALLIRGKEGGTWLVLGTLSRPQTDVRITFTDLELGLSYPDLRTIADALQDQTRKERG